MCGLLCCCGAKCCCLICIIVLVVVLGGGIFVWQWIEYAKDEVDENDTTDNNLRFLADSDELSFEQILMDGAKL